MLLRSIKLQLACTERRKACLDFPGRHILHRPMRPLRPVILIDDAGTNAFEIVVAPHQPLSNAKVC